MKIQDIENDTEITGLWYTEAVFSDKFNSTGRALRLVKPTPAKIYVNNNVMRVYYFVRRDKNDNETYKSVYYSGDEDLSFFGVFGTREEAIEYYNSKIYNRLDYIRERFEAVSKLINSYLITE